MDAKRSCRNHIDNLTAYITTENKGFSTLKNIQKILTLQSLIMVYKVFIRSYLDYGEISFKQTNNENVCRKLGSVQYNAALAFTGAIRGSS